MPPTATPPDNPFQSPERIAREESPATQVPSKPFTLFWALAILGLVSILLAAIVNGLIAGLGWLPLFGLTFLHAYLKLRKYPPDLFPNSKKQFGELFFSAAVTLGLFMWCLLCVALTVEFVPRLVQLVVPSINIKDMLFGWIAIGLWVVIYFVCYAYTIRPMFSKKPAKPSE
ncbi:hypothetical protein AB1L30_01850 [Bremerella sp. JC817]|uniref:hypothetical protein n=1 Tax=Bremerella sp. JC817 TaxID=3231756 RepID=UPI00345B3746